MYLRNEIFVNVFLYHFEKGKSDSDAAFESFHNWATSGIHKPLTARNSQNICIPSFKLHIKLPLLSSLFDLTFTPFLAPIWWLVAQTLAIVLRGKLCCIESFHCYLVSLLSSPLHLCYSYHADYFILRTFSCGLLHRLQLLLTCESI